MQIIRVSKFRSNELMARVSTFEADAKSSGLLEICLLLDGLELKTLIDDG